MGYDEGLAQRIRELLRDMPGFVEKKMFGGVGYLLHGNMACGVNKDNLIVRLGPERDEEAMGMPHTKPFNITVRPMKGWVMVMAEGYESDEDLGDWVQQGIDFALSLPPK